MRKDMIAMLLLAGCTNPPITLVEFPAEDWYPKPAPGIVINEDQPFRIIYKEVATRTRSCVMRYHNQETELVAKLECLKQLKQ